MRHSRQSKPLRIIATIALLLSVLVVLGFNRPDRSARAIMKEMQKTVEAAMLPPTVSARLYALTLTVYSETLTATSGDTYCAVETAREIGHIVLDQPIAPPTSSCDRSALERWAQWHQDDRAYHTRSYIKPPAAKWSSVAPPVTPNAGAWRRFHVQDPIAVPPPPTTWSIELIAVQSAASRRTSADGRDITVFAGGPGTEGPSGIWLDIYDMIAQAEHVSNERYARESSLLARIVADAFAEAWRVKFTYWTARPISFDSSLPIAMTAPNFPGYVSGHATISAAAATTIACLHPSYHSTVFELAERAKQSRLTAGIHFPADNDAGFALGRQVADQGLVSISCGE